jgi:hypothetical protein
MLTFVLVDNPPESVTDAVTAWVPLLSTRLKLARPPLSHQCWKSK